MAEPEQIHGRVRDAKSAPLKRSPLTFFVLVFALALPFWPLGALVKHVPLPINFPR